MFVIATFKEAGVHGRLRVLVEAESLLNGGTAAVAFAVAVGMAGGSGGSLPQIAGSLVLTIGGGVLCGAAAGFALMWLAGRTTDHLGEITFSALTAGLVTGIFRVPHPKTDGREAVESSWEYVGFVINSLIFLLIGSREAQLHFGGVGLAVMTAVVLVTLGRALAIYPPCALFMRSRLAVDIKHQHVLFWGGLRGALALALALELPDTLANRDDLVTVAFAVVAFSIFVQGLTMTPLLRILGQLDQPSPGRLGTNP